MRSFVCAVEKLVAEAPRVDVCTADDARLRSLTASVRAAQRCLDGVITKIGLQAQNLVEAGQSDGATSVLGSQGAVGGRTVQREASRADLAAELPGLADTLASGEASGEHADVLTRRTSGPLSSRKLDCFAAGLR